MTIRRLFTTSTQGPSSPSADTGVFTGGVGFQVTQWGCWLAGYSIWTPPGGDTIPVDWRLWQVWGTLLGSHDASEVTGPRVTSAAPVVGQWNDTVLPTASWQGLSAFQPYVIGGTWTAVNGFPLTQAQFGSGQPLSGGITDGPLNGYSDTSGSNPMPGNWGAQGLFDTVAGVPSQGFNSGNFWVTPLVSDTPPAGAELRLRPGQPHLTNGTNDTPQDHWSLGEQFNLSAPVSLRHLYFQSPAVATQLPTECGIWSVAGQSLIAATHQTSPAWSGAAGSGEVSVAYSNATLPAGDYKVAVFNGGSIANPWNLQANPYYASGGQGANGINNGVLSAPNVANAASPGQGTYQLGAGPAFVYPNTYSGVSPTYGLDVGVIPVSSGGLLMASGII